jgi:hypothetical protein
MYGMVVTNISGETAVSIFTVKVNPVHSYKVSLKL